MILIDIPPHNISKFKKKKSLIYTQEDVWESNLIEKIY